MKNFAINTASNTLTAIALVGAMCMAAPAKADSSDVVKGLAAIFIIKELVAHNQPQVQTEIIDRQVWNQSARQAHGVQEQVRKSSINTVCHSEYRTATNGTLVRYDYNCQGNVVRVSR